MQLIMYFGVNKKLINCRIIRTGNNEKDDQTTQGLSVSHCYGRNK